MVVLYDKIKYKSKQLFISLLPCISFKFICRCSSSDSVRFYVCRFFWKILIIYMHENKPDSSVGLSSELLGLYSPDRILVPEER